MSIILYNDGWMLYNSFLALFAVGFGLLSLWFKGRYLKILFGFLWLLFLPNTIYIFTDLIHLIHQWHQVSSSFILLLLLQYILYDLIGFFTFMVGLLPFEKLLLSINVLNKRQSISIIVINFYIAFCLVMGRVERINSWDIFTQPLKVIKSTIHVFITFDLLGLMILFWLFCNFLYFLFRKPFLKKIKRVFHIWHYSLLFQLLYH